MATTSLIESTQNEYQSMDNPAHDGQKPSSDAVVSIPENTKKDPAAANPGEKYGKEFKSHRYAVNKSVGQGVTNVALVTSNSSQLKNVIDKGSSHPYFYFFVIGLSISIALQVVLGYMLVWASSRESKLKGTTNKGTRKTDKLNQSVLYIIFAISILNIIMNAFAVGTQ